MKTSVYLSIFNELSQVIGFETLSKTTKELFKNLCDQQNSESKQIHIKYDQTNLLYCDNDLDLPDFYKILEFFDDISIEIDYSFKVCNPIYNLISKMKEKTLPKLKIVIIVRNRKDSLIDEIKAKEFECCSAVKKVTLPPALVTIEKKRI